MARHESDMQTITCLINDNYPGTSNPLIYVVEVKDPQNHDEVLKAVEAERRADIGDENEEVELELLLAFAGDVPTLADWRE